MESLPFYEVPLGQDSLYTPEQIEAIASTLPVCDSAGRSRLPAALEEIARSYLLEVAYQTEAGRTKTARETMEHFVAVFTALVKAYDAWPEAARQEFLALYEPEGAVSLMTMLVRCEQDAELLLTNFRWALAQLPRDPRGPQANTPLKTFVWRLADLFKDVTGCTPGRSRKRSCPSQLSGPFVDFVHCCCLPAFKLTPSTIDNTIDHVIRLRPR